MSKYSDKYPIKNKAKYLQSIGRLLPHRIGQILKELNFTRGNDCKIWMNPSQGNDVDLKVWHNSALILVAEVLNWSVKSWLSEKRKGWIIKNLSKYDCWRVLIYTTFSNEYLLENLSLNKISLLKIDFQLLPKSFYDFFVKKSQIEFREVDSRNSRRFIKSKLIEYLQSSGIEFVFLDIDELTVTEM